MKEKQLHDYIYICSVYIHRTALALGCVLLALGTLLAVLLTEGADEGEPHIEAVLLLFRKYIARSTVAIVGCPVNVE